MNAGVVTKELKMFLVKVHSAYIGTVADLVAVGFPASIYLFKVNNQNTRKMCEIFLKETRKSQERYQ